MKRIKLNLISIIQILRWNKPTGRLILLIPAGWSMWLIPNNNLDITLFIKIILGGLLVSGFGCVANDIWDVVIDKKVLRTKKRPLASNRLDKKIAYFILILFLLASFFLILSIQEKGNLLSLVLAFLAVPFILIYPSAKRWFKYPQLILSFCWGFAVLIPWAVLEGNIKSPVLLLCWLATFFWTFGFDTIYALADKKYDLEIGLNSSAINLKSQTNKIVHICYLLTSIFLASSATLSGISPLFWPIWLMPSILMQIDTIKIFRRKEHSITQVGQHFSNQVIYGSLFLLGIIISK